MLGFASNLAQFNISKRYEIYDLKKAKNFKAKRLDNANHYTPFTGTHKMAKITTQAEMIEWLRTHRKMH